MKKRKIFGFVLILIGLLLIGYPLKLRLNTRIAQKRLREEFNKTIEKPKDENIEKGQEPISYDAWPDTLMTIPAIDLEAMVVEMETNDIDVFDGNPNYPPAHYINTDFPGGPSNVAIAAHRTGPADYFRHLDKLNEGDAITLETEKAVHEYIVERVFIVDPTDTSVIKPTDYGALTLTSCEREDGISNKKRIIVRARLKDDMDKVGD